MIEQRLVFGEDAELYDSARPSYPPELVDDVVALVELPARTVDVGCGTGKATVMLAERGVTGVGVEPDAAMAEIARRKLERFSSWRVDISDFEEWQPKLGETPFDLITVAQAWHWIDRERGTKQAERLLRSGGWLAIFGHRPNPPDTPLRRDIDTAYAKYAPKPSGRSQAPKERVALGSAFGEPIKREYPGWRDYTAKDWIALMKTSSDHRILPEEQRRRLFEAITAAIEKHGQGVYRHHYVAELWAVQHG
jgi:SAM-dependent methyltransferase